MEKEKQEAKRSVSLNIFYKLQPVLKNYEFISLHVRLKVISSSRHLEEPAVSLIYNTECVFTCLFSCNKIERVLMWLNQEIIIYE